MKITKHLNLIVIASLLTAVVVSGFSINNLINSAPVAGKDLPAISASGIIKEEFYFRPAGDNRLWHIINRYNVNNNTSIHSSQINNSEYIFTNDNVTVINEINNH